MIGRQSKANPPGQYESAVAALTARHDQAVAVIDDALSGERSVTALRDALLDVRSALRPAPQDGAA